MGKHHHDGERKAGSIGCSGQIWIRQVARRLAICTEKRCAIPNGAIVSGIGRLASAVPVRPHRPPSIASAAGIFRRTFEDHQRSRFSRIGQPNLAGVQPRHRERYYGSVRRGRRLRGFLACGPRPPHRDRACRRLAQRRAIGADRSTHAVARSDCRRLQGRVGKQIQARSASAAAITRYRSTKPLPRRFRASTWRGRRRDVPG